MITLLAATGLGIISALGAQRLLTHSLSALAIRCARENYNSTGSAFALNRLALAAHVARKLPYLPKRFGRTHGRIGEPGFR